MLLKSFPLACMMLGLGRNNMEEHSYWLGFSVFPGIGPGRFAKLLASFGSAKDAWEATEEELKKVIGSALASGLAVFRKEFSLSDYEEKLTKAKVSYVILNDPHYPLLLKQIKNPPFVLFVKGNLEILNSQNVIPDLGREDPGNSLDSRLRGNDSSSFAAFIGIVGTRKITDYGKHVTELLTRELVDAGCVIVSGLALGVDAVAHQTTIDADGKTIAVLGCGIDCCYPRENEQLYSQILKNSGVIVSEYGLGQPPSIGSFPSRNRIIAGLSLGVLVTEGAEHSGALITAKDAIANGRKVFAVPGPVTSSLSQGPYQLLKNGATLVRSGKEILEELGVKGAKRDRRDKEDRGLRGDNEQEQSIIDLLQTENLHFDELVRRTEIDSSALGGLLSLMEMKGMIKSLDAGMFALL